MSQARDVNLSFVLELHTLSLRLCLLERGVHLHAPATRVPIIKFPE